MGGAALPVAAGATAAGATAAGATIAGGAVSAYGAGQAGRAQSNYYSYLARNAQMNAGLAKASEAVAGQEIGAQLSQQDRLIGEHVRSTIGAQTAAFAAGGVGASSRSAQDIIADTIHKGDLDEQALRYNAAMKMKAATLGYGTQAMNLEAQAGGDLMAGANARTATGYNQLSTILGTGGSVASMWYRFPRYLGGSY